MKHVLFVDIRNAIRSPMAEAWFNYLADDYSTPSRMLAPELDSAA